MIIASFLKIIATSHEQTPKGTWGSGGIIPTWAENFTEGEIWWHDSIHSDVTWIENINYPILIYLIKRNPSAAISYSSNVWLALWLFLQCLNQKLSKTGAVIEENCPTSAGKCHQKALNAMDFAATITVYIRSTVIMADPGRRREDFLGRVGPVGWIHSLRSTLGILSHTKKN